MGTPLHRVAKNFAARGKACARCFLPDETERMNMAFITASVARNRSGF